MYSSSVLFPYLKIYIKHMESVLLIVAHVAKSFEEAQRIFDSTRLKINLLTNQSKYQLLY